MQDSFNKFKKKVLLEVLIKTITIGLSLGIISFSAPLLYFKINKIEYNLLYLFLIGIGVFVFVFGLLFLILRPTRIKVAKRIDKQLNLNEKVQTMVEYENEESFMIKVQREDTLSILSNISIKKLTMKFSLVFFLLIFIACSLCVTSFAYPTEKEDDTEVNDDEEEDEDYEVDDWTIRALKDLIKVVEKSTIVDSLKVKYVAELNNLIVEIENADKNSEMKSLVFALIDTVKLELDIVNTNNEVYEVLKGSSSKAISSFAIKLYNLEVEEADKAIDSIVAEINGVYNAIPELNENFGAILNKSLLNKEEELCKALIELASELMTCVNSKDVPVKDALDNNVYSKVSETVNKYRKTINNIVSQQRENYDIALYIEETLLTIFGLVEENTEEDDENKDPNNQESTDPDENDEQGGAVEGGLGTGEVLFGSDDTLFDPEKGEVKYGDVITGYYGTILGKLNDGTLSEEYRENFEYYFKLLFGTLEENE